MRLLVAEKSVDVSPGSAATIQLEAVNTLDVIDGVTATIVGLPGATVEAQPSFLPLFPGSAGHLTVRLTLPPDFPAGSHQAEVEVHSSVVPDEVARSPLHVDVVAQPAFTVVAEPLLQSSRRKARFCVVCENAGNTNLNLVLAASDPERALKLSFDRTDVSLAPGEQFTSVLALKARPQPFGQDVTRAVTIVVTSGEIAVEAAARFRQRPVVPRGLRTALLLAAIVALWAGAFLLAVNRAFATDPQTKSAPASFYAGAKVKNAVAISPIGPIQDAAADPPPGAVPKQGINEAIGAQISGTVNAASTGQGVGRITIQAIRNTPSGPTVVSSAASESDGTYEMFGLLPGEYDLRFSATGFQDVWYPAAKSAADANLVTVGAFDHTTSIDTTISGLPGTLTGAVDTGQTTPVPVTVVVLPQQGNTTTPIANVVSDATGHYSIPNLPTPGTYDLSFSAAGYRVTADVEVLGGGDKRVANMVHLGAAAGEIDGLITNGSAPLGGVTITASSNGQTVTSATPTAGPIGHFALTGLASPATWLLTFAATGFGTQTLAVPLGPGQKATNLAISMLGGTGDVAGRVVDSNGQPLGNVTVMVDGGPASLTTRTLTSGAGTGNYQLSGLVTPGIYTVTFALPGYQSLTLPLNLSSGGPAGSVNATLTPVVGAFQGTVTGPPSGGGPVGPLAGATVTVTDGGPAQTAISTSAPPGGFLVVGVAAGTYSISFSLNGYCGQTIQQALASGQHLTVNVSLSRPPAGGTC